MNGRVDVKRSRITCLTVAVLASVSVSMPAFAGEFEGDAQGDEVVLTAREARAAEAAAAAVAPGLRLVEYARGDLCYVHGVISTPLNGPCGLGGGAVAVPGCDGAAPVQPLWRRARATPVDPWTGWEYVVGWSCPQDASPVLTAEDFRRLPLAPPVLSVQPDRATVLVNMPTITFSTATPQTFVTDLLGYPVEVAATPTTFTWDFGDGSAPLVTTGPGRPWPDHEVAYAYPAPGTYTITLRTDFAGRYRLAGTTAWQPVAGVATTTTTSPPVTAVEARTRLVAEDCTTHPDPDTC